MNVVNISVLLTLGLISLALLLLAAFGVKSVTNGKVSPMTSVAVIVPVILLLALGFSVGDWSQAAVYTVLIMLVLSIGTMVLSSAKGLFN